MLLPGTRRYHLNRLVLCCFAACGIFSHTVRAGTNATQILAPTFTLRTGAGYKDNVTLSHFQPHGSPFIRSGLDIDWLGDFSNDTQVLFFLTGDDWFYWNRASTSQEDLWTGAVEFKKKCRDDLSFSTMAFYGFENQVLDLSTEENIDTAPTEVIGHTLALRPAVRWTFAPDWWTQAKLDLTRQFFSHPADSYTRAGPELRLGGNYGNDSEWSVAYEPLWQRYDHGRAPDAVGLPLDRARADFRQRLELNDTHNWDLDGHWQNIGQLFFEYDADNGEGFFNYYRYGGALEFDYDDHGWEVVARTDAARFRYLHQTATLAGTAKWYIADVTVDLQLRKALAHWLKTFVEYQYERSFSNRLQQDYQANTISGGLEWIF